MSCQDLYSGVGVMRGEMPLPSPPYPCPPLSPPPLSPTSPHTYLPLTHPTPPHLPLPPLPPPQILVPGMSQADLQLELVLLISAMASDDHCCQQLATSNVIPLLYQLWKEKAEDSEIILQLIHCFHKFLQNEVSREEAMYR